MLDTTPYLNDVHQRVSPLKFIPKWLLLDLTPGKFRAERPVGAVSDALSIRLPVRLLLHGQRRRTFPGIPPASRVEKGNTFWGQTHALIFQDPEDQNQEVLGRPRMFGVQPTQPKTKGYSENTFWDQTHTQQQHKRVQFIEELTLRIPCGWTQTS